MDRILKRNSRNGNNRRRPGSGGRRNKINHNGHQIVSSENVDNEVLLQKLLRALPPPWPWQGLVDLTPRALSRRLCARPQSNQLYRSDSFKFERFHPEDSSSLDIAPYRRQVSLCDDYSVPIDLVNRRRPNSLGCSARWLATSSINGQEIEIIDTYTDPRDSKAYLEPGEEAGGKVYTSPDRDYSLPYTDNSSEAETPEEEEEHEFGACAACDGGNRDQYETVRVEGEEAEGPTRRRTPYYYGDLIAARSDGAPSPMPPHTPRDRSQMSRRLYETAFDCRVSRSEDELEVDLVTHQSLLQSTTPPQQPSQQTPRQHSQSHSQQPPPPSEASNVLAQEFSRMGLGTYPATPTPPSSAPLPTKFPSSHSMNSVRSAPNLPGARIKDSRLPVKSLRCRSHKDPRTLEGRPRSPDKHDSSQQQRRGRLKYSSSESMATSSSGGSLESIRSSTSEGNRSTTSSDSHPSSSLSSHTSDDASNPPLCQLTGSGTIGSTTSRLLHGHQTRLHMHILSPISDKSSQEPGSETSENNKNNNSQGSPEENTLGSTPIAESSELPISRETNQKTKKRIVQNKNLIKLGCPSTDLDTHQAGSDSGISIESSRCPNNQNLSQVDLADLPFDMPKLRRRRMQQQDSDSFRDLPFDMPKLRRRQQQQQQQQFQLQQHQQQENSGSTTSVDLHDLPFDMPKLRRRAQQQQPQQQQELLDNSGSTTSVDLKDLPFDMPKLRRRPRAPPSTTESSGVSHASSSHSFQESDNRVSRPSLTLDLDMSMNHPRSLGLCLDLGETSSAQIGEDIDINLSLEKQGWYHGTITRLEAESVLRPHKEGSYLVRNSESSRQDYSLSLKSAKGFMHMRIQQCRETGKYILGQFSSPFNNIPSMIKHYTVNRLPIRGAEHMCLLHPVIEQLL